MNRERIEKYFQEQQNQETLVQVGRIRVDLYELPIAKRFYVVNAEFQVARVMKRKMYPAFYACGARMVADGICYFGNCIDEFLVWQPLSLRDEEGEQ